MQFAATLLLFEEPVGPSGYRILSISRGDDLKDWGLVGGKVEPGESMEKCLMREVQEEAGVIVSLMVPVYTGMARTRITTTFLALEATLPEKMYVTREGTVAWKQLLEVMADDCTYRDYNLRMFKHMGLWPAAVPQRASLPADKKNALMKQMWMHLLALQMSMRSRTKAIERAKMDMSLWLHILGFNDQEKDEIWELLDSTE